MNSLSIQLQSYEIMMQICYCTLYIACIQLHLYVAHNPTPTAQLDEALRPYARSYSWSCMAEPLSQGAQLHLQLHAAARGVRPRLCPILAGSTLLRCEGRQCDFHERIGLSQGGNKARRMGHRNHRQGWVAPWQSESHVCSISKTTWRIFVLRLK